MYLKISLGLEKTLSFTYSMKDFRKVICVCKIELVNLLFFISSEIHAFCSWTRGHFSPVFFIWNVSCCSLYEASTFSYETFSIYLEYFLCAIFVLQCFSFCVGMLAKACCRMCLFRELKTFIWFWIYFCINFWCTVLLYQRSQLQEYYYT